jgi:hypothetical protein
MVKCTFELIANRGQGPKKMGESGQHTVPNIAELLVIDGLEYIVDQRIWKMKNAYDALECTIRLRTVG